MSANGARYFVYVRSVSAPHAAATSIMRVMFATAVSLVSSSSRSPRSATASRTRAK